jgi:hypothetical protein
MNQSDWQQLADDRIHDAQALRDASRWSGAYYLTGYAVECALKCCVVRHLTNNPGIIFEDKQFSVKSWTHDLLELVKLSGLEQARSDAVAQNAALGENWLVVKDWNENSRYRQTAQAQAEELWVAVNSDPDGVLKWIKNYW